MNERTRIGQTIGLVFLAWALIAVFMFFLLSYQTKFGSAAVPDSAPSSTFWITNGDVNDMVIVTNTLYVAGDFTYVGPNTGYMAALDETTGDPDMAFPKFGGSVYDIVSDGSNGWYVGGSFSSVGGYSIPHLAHINSDGSVDTAWVPTPGGTVHSISVTGTIMYVAGDFYSGVSDLDPVKAVDITAGSMLAWDPDVEGGSVYSVIAHGGSVYFGGQFSSVGGEVRNGLAEVDAATAAVTSWDPGLNLQSSSVQDLHVATSTIYVAGGFSMVGGDTRNGIAEIDLTTGSSTSWNPLVNASSLVMSIDVTTSSVYVAGSIFEIGADSRSNVGEIDRTTGLATAWDPNANGVVREVVAGASSVYLAGAFTNAGGADRDYFVVVNNTDGSATAWNSSVSDQGRAIALDGTTIYLGGDFISAGGYPRNNVAAIDLTTGEATGWDPDSSDEVTSIAATGTSIFVGGSFTSVGGNNRNRIAELDMTTGSSTSWNPGADSSVDTIVVGTSTLYVSGAFAAIGAENRAQFAELDIATGVPTSWDPAPNGLIEDMVFTDDTLYVAGQFTSLAGEVRNHIGSFDLATKSLTAWDPNADEAVSNIELEGNVLYAGGNFTTIGGGSREWLAGIDTTSGLLTSWNPVAQSGITAMKVSDSVLYVSGFFTQLNGATRNRMGALSTISAVPTAWDPNVAVNNATTILVTDDAVYAGGSFTLTGGTARNLATFYQEPNSVPSLSDVTLTPQTNGSGDVAVSVAAADGDSDYLNIKIEYLSGDCSVYAGQSTSTLADASATSGSASLNNDAPFGYQVGGVATPNTVSVTWESAQDLPDAEGEYCVFLTPNDDIDSGTTASSTVTIDNIEPTTPSALSVASSSTTSVVLNLSTTTSTDTRFSEYKIFYTTGTTTPTADDSSITSSTDSNLGDENFNSATTTTLSGLTAGQQYTASIWAYDTYGNYASSTAVTFTTVAPPATVPDAPIVSLSSRSNTLYNQALKVVVDPGENSTSTTQFAICTTSNGTVCDATGYVVSSTVEGVEMALAIADSASSTIWRTYDEWGGSVGVVVNGLEPATLHQFLVFAKGGDDVVSDASVANDPVYTRPNTPTNITTSTLTDTSFVLSWGANGNPVGTIYYLIIEEEGGDVAFVTTTVGTSATVSSLTCETEYVYGFGAATPDLEEADGEGVIITVTTAACDSDGGGESGGGGGGGGGFIPPQNPPTEEPPVEPPTEEPVEPPTEEPPVEEPPVEVPPPTEEPTEPPKEQPPTEPVTPSEPPSTEPTVPPTTEPTTPPVSEPVDPGVSEPTTETPVNGGGSEPAVEPGIITPPTTPTTGTIVVPPQEASDVSSLLYRLDTFVERAKKAVQNISIASIRDSLRNTPEKAVAAAKQVQEFVDNPEVEKANERVVAPTVAAVAVTNAAVGIGLPQILVFLRYLFSQPLLLLRRRKQKNWGTVYNAFTKQPVDLATIRIFDSKTGNLIRSQVTDREGRYFLMLDPGEYRIEVDKTGFARGSELLHGKSEDVAFANLYHIGQLVTVTEAQSEINLNIPLDPAGQDKPTKTIIREYTAKVFQYTITTLGLIVTIVSFAISPTVFVGALLVLHVCAYILFNILSHKKPKGSVGVVVSDDKKEPLGKVAIRVFDAAYDKLIDTAVTDSKGRYAMLVGPSTYYVTYDKPGFEKKQSPTIDYSSEKTQGRGAMIARNESLKKASGQTGAPLSPPPTPQEPVSTVDQSGNM